jgi:hypothetical protein
LSSAAEWGLPLWLIGTTAVEVEAGWLKLPRGKTKEATQLGQAAERVKLTLLILADGSESEDDIGQWAVE